MDTLARLKLRQAKADLIQRSAVRSPSPIAVIGDGEGNVIAGFEDCLWVRHDNAVTWARNLSGNTYQEGDVVTVRPMSTGRTPTMLRIVDRYQFDVTTGCLANWGGDESWLCHQLPVKLLGAPPFIFNDEDELYGGVFTFRGEPMNDDSLFRLSLANTRFLPSVGYHPSVFTIPAGVYSIDFHVEFAAWSSSTTGPFGTTGGNATFYANSNWGRSIPIVSRSLPGSGGDYVQGTPAYIAGGATQPGEAWQFSGVAQHQIAMEAIFRIFGYAYETPSRRYRGYIPCDSMNFRRAG